jgi:hypothetical protein
VREGQGHKKRRRRRTRRPALPAYAFVFDTESTTDPSQALTFGSYRLLRRYHEAQSIEYECLEEGLFYGDNAPAEAIARLKAYARRGADTSVNGSGRLTVEPLSAFVERFFVAAVRVRALIVGMNLPFDLARLAFDVTEARKGARGGFSLILSRRSDRLGEPVEHSFRPRVTVKAIDSKRALKALTHPNDADRVDRIPDDSETGKLVKGHYPRGNFLDLRTLAFALTDRSHSLASACKAFGVDCKSDPGGHPGWDFDDAYIDYNRRDTRITGELMAAMLREYDHHPIAVAPTDVYSPASIGKGYLAAMGASPLLDRWPGFPKDELGFAMSTFYGGRTSTRIRRFLVPVRYCDFLSMYPTVNALLGTWDLLTAAGYRIVDVTDRARELLATVTLDRLFDRGVWPELCFFAQLRPEGDILPVRAKWDTEDARQIGINPLTAGNQLWYAGPDLVAAALLGSKPPRIERAFAIVPARDERGKVARLKSLRRVKLLGSIPIDPRSDSFFQKVIEERQRARKDPTLSEADRDRFDKGLKVIANATSYGILAQMDPIDVRKDETPIVDVYGALGSFETRTTKPEKPGDYFFPPIAALITAAARCMLAMLERSVADLGGTYAMEDTDSMAIVATERGGLVPCPGGPHSWTRKDARTYTGPNARAATEAVRALSFAEVDAIAERFRSLNPYDPIAVPLSVLKVEEVNFDAEERSRQLWCYAISSKRYALYALDDRGEPHATTQYSEHGLGHLLNPTDPDSEDRDWIEQTWDAIAREHLGLPIAQPSWLDRPALTRLAITSPYLLAPFEARNVGLPYPERIKPFNFLLAAHVSGMGFPSGIKKAACFLLVAPYESNPIKWAKLPWNDVHSGRRFGIATDRDQWLYHPDRALIQTYRGTLAEYRLQPEAKSLGPDGTPCDELHRDCAGLLARRPAIVPPNAIENIGKEMNELEGAEAGIVHDEDRVATRYRDPRVVPFDDIRILLRCIPMPELVRRTRLSERTIERARLGRRTPHHKNQLTLREAIRSYALEGGDLSLEAFERINPHLIAGELRGPKSAGESARGALRARYVSRIRSALQALGL